MSTTLYNQYIYKDNDWRLVGTSVDQPTKTSDLINDSGYITSSDIPVTSVNTKTGDVVLTAADVNAQPQINISGILKGDGAGAITAATAGTDYQSPLPSQTGNTGKFLTTNGSTLSWQTVDALPAQSGNTGKFLTTDGSSASWAEVDIPTKTSELTNDSDFVSDANYVHTDNNFTTTLKNKLDGIAEGATVDDHKWAGVSLGATGAATAANQYVPVKSSMGNTDGTADWQTVTSNPSSYNIPKYDSNAYLKSTTPSADDSSTKVATTAFVSNAISSLGSVLNYKGTKATVSELPSTGNETGDVWIITADSSEYVWNGTAWEKFGPTIDLSGYVPTSRTVNGKALSTDISLSASDVGALPDTTAIPAATSDLTNDSGFITSSDIPVISVNNKTGAVSLTASDVGALPDSTTIPQGTVTSVRVQATSPVQSSTNTAQSTTLNTTISLADSYGDTKNPYAAKAKNTVLAGPSTGTATAPSFRTLEADDIPSLTVSKISDFPSTMTPSSHSHGYVSNDGKVLSQSAIGNGDRLVITDSSDSDKIATSSITFGTSTTTFLTNNGTWKTPNYPVTSVNTKTGAVSLTASDVGALPDTTEVPTATSDLTNDSGFITSSDIPVTSVNSKTGAVVLTATDLGALTNSYFGYFDADNNIIYAPKNWDSSYLFPFIVRTISSTLRTGATVRAFDSSTNLWTISSIYYDGVAKTLPLNLSYGIYLMRYSDGTTDIYRIAKVSDIPKLTDIPTANKGAQYDSSAYLNSTTPTAGDNSTKVATTAFVNTAISSSSSIKSITNPALTVSEGIFTWSIAAADAYSSPDIIITIYDTATGAVVYPDVIVNQSTGAVTITIRDTTSVGNIAAGAYKAVMIG